MKKLIFTVGILSLLLTACPDGGGGGSNEVTTAPPPTYSDDQECSNQQFSVGIPGNAACPYQGGYDPNYGYQGFAVNYSKSYGIGFKIDFGWDYNDMCPTPGQIPIFQNGRFSHCEGVNPTFAQTDFANYTQPNIGECAGNQYMNGLTGCRPNLSPASYGSNPQYFPPTSGGSNRPGF